MTFPILVDENTSPRVAEMLGQDGHDAEHVIDVLAPGATDEAILEHAVETDAVLLTHDDDFLSLDGQPASPILYYSDDTLAAREIADRVRRVIELVPDPDDLQPVTNLGEWSR